MAGRIWRRVRMSNKVHGWKTALLTVLLLVWCCCTAVLAEGASGDNSLASLGITTEGVTVSPEFVYSTIEYQVTVPAGTTELSLDPVTSNAYATITDISGTTLNENSEGTVVITVVAENGSAVSYYLYVKPDASAAAAQTEAQTEKETEPPTEKETEPETEDPRYVKVDRNSLEEAENTIAALKKETANYRDRQNFLMKVLYGLIAFCVVLLFVVINLILKKKDLKAELRTYQAYGYAGGEAGSVMQEQAGYGQPYDGPEYGQAYDSQEMYPEEQYEADVPAAGSRGWESAAEGQISYRSEASSAEKSQGKEKKKKKAAVKDDPATVPKPSKAKKQPKKMPEYQKPEPAPEYQPRSEKSKKDVEVTMIDL